MFLLQRFALTALKAYMQQWCSQNVENVTHIKGRLLDQQWFSLIASLFKMGTSLKGKNSERILSSMSSSL